MITRPRRWKYGSLVLALAVLVGTTSVGYAAAAADRGGIVFVQTVPGLAGVRIAVRSQVVTTGPGGTASVQVADLNGIASRVALADTQLDAADSLAIAKVQPAPHAAAHESRLTVGLDITSRVGLRIDSGHTGVPAGTVQSVRLHSVTGQRLTVDPRQTPTVSLISRRTQLVRGTLIPQVVSWSVDSVRVGPGVSLSAKQPGFDPFGHPTWQLRLQPVRGTVVVDTVPKTAGVVFALDGATITTGADGRGTGVVSDLNDVGARLRLDSPSAGPVSVSLLRVAKLPPGARFQRHLLAALAVRRPVSLSFKDARGAPVPATRISEVRLRGGGITVTLTGQQISQPVSLLSRLATQVDAAWQPRQLTYAVASVHLEGGNAVFAGQQRFDPNSTANWPISVSVFTLKVTVRDVVFGTRISSTAWVTRPDGVRYRVKLGSQSPTVLTSMVRGDYDVEAESAVYGSHTKLLVSRNDEVDLRVVTGLDLLVIVLVAALLAGSVILLGRSLRRAHTRRSAVAGQ